VYEKSKGNDEVHKELVWLLAQVKRMSDDNGGTRDHNYEEMEWRLLSHRDYNQAHFTEINEKVRRLKFGPRDVKIIIFPNEETQLRALNDSDVKAFFSQHTPMMVTLDDCSSF
jgi:hypothetical protein